MDALHHVRISVTLDGATRSRLSIYLGLPFPAGLRRGTDLRARALSARAGVHLRLSARAWASPAGISARRVGFWLRRHDGQPARQQRTDAERRDVAAADAHRA